MRSLIVATDSLHFSTPTLKTRADLFPPCSHLRSVGLFRKRFDEGGHVLSECGDSVCHSHSRALGAERFDLNHNAGGVRTRSDSHIFGAMSFAISIHNGPYRFVARRPFSKHGVAAKIDRPWKNRCGIPALHPFALALRTEEWESSVGAARQLEATAAPDLLCRTRSHLDPCQSDERTCQNYAEWDHNVYPSVMAALGGWLSLSMAGIPAGSFTQKL
jgi:hypothetical protein